MKAQICPFREQIVTDDAAIGDVAFNKIERREKSA